MSRATFVYGGSTNITRLSVNNCFVILFTTDACIIYVAISHSCRTAFRLFPLRLDEKYFAVTNWSNNIFFLYWTGRPIIIEFVRPMDLTFVFGNFVDNNYIEE